MSCENNKMDEMKLKLKLVTKRKLKAERYVYNVRLRENNLVEEIKLVRAESEFVSQQLEVVKQQISEIKYQVAMIDICSTSEKAKNENHLAYINSHNNGFDVLFSKENKILELQKKELMEKETQKQELERQKREKVLELEEQKAKEAAAIENECLAIESECNILRKRNKAIMLKLRRKLIETEETRRKLMQSEK